MRENSLKHVKQGMRKPLSGSRYYAFETTATEHGTITRGIISHWIGFTRSSPRREIREGSLVNPDFFIRYWRGLRIPYVVVSTKPQMIVYRFTGGCALVEKSLAEKHFGNLVQSHQMAPDGPLGWKSIEHVPPHSLNRAPSAKLRMKILKRDRYRCRICGRRTADHTDVELHVHHIHPWSGGGLTEEENLITLCHTCHNGLEPHQDAGLFELLGEHPLSTNAYVRRVLEGMLRYQRLIKGVYGQEKAKTAAAAAT